MKTRQEIKEGILANCVNGSGSIDISGLDFSDFDGDVHKGEGKVKRHLGQGKNEVEGNLFQGHNKVKGHLLQYRNEVEGDLYQDRNEVEGDLFNEHNEVEGDLYQYDNRVKGKTLNDFRYHNKVMKCDSEEQTGVEDERFVKPLEDMSKEELIKKIREMEVK